MLYLVMWFYAVIISAKTRSKAWKGKSCLWAFSIFKFLSQCSHWTERTKERVHSEQTHIIIFTIPYTIGILTIHWTYRSIMCTFMYYAVQMCQHIIFKRSQAGFQRHAKDLRTCDKPTPPRKLSS